MKIFVYYMLTPSAFEKTPRKLNGEETESLYFIANISHKLSK